MIAEILDAKGEVINRIVAEQDFLDAEYPGKWREVEEVAAPAPAEPVPAEISPRQLLIGLADKGWITADEALAAATAGTPPAAVEAVFKALPTEQQLPARITWARMTTVLRSDPLVPLLAAAKGQDDAAVDDFFRVYSKV